MRTVSFREIVSLGITPAECVEWATTVIKNKRNYVLPHKISIPYGDERFFNTMPSYIPEQDLFGVKIVSRIPGRKPVIKGDIMLYDTASGDMKAFIDGTWITAWRTAAVAAVTVGKLKRENAKTISIVGLGNIARAFLMCVDSMENHKELDIHILAYKNQHEEFIERFKEYGNIRFTVHTDIKEMFGISDVIVSCVTAATSLFSDDDSVYRPGVLVVPVQTRGFQNCDLTFDRIFCDDIPHISGFKYFKQYKSVTEMTDVLNDDGFHRGGVDRILAYNIGISIQDIYFASKILERIEDCKEERKFWV